MKVIKKRRPCNVAEGALVMTLAGVPSRRGDVPALSRRRGLASILWLGGAAIACCADELTGSRYSVAGRAAPACSFLTAFTFYFSHLTPR